MTKILQETTEWEDNIPNHTYIVKDNKMLGYIKAGTDEVIEFAKPLMFDKRKRTFKELKDKNIISKFD